MNEQQYRPNQPMMNEQQYRPNQPMMNEQQYRPNQPMTDGFLNHPGNQRPQGVVYTRQQTGHSLIKHLLLGWMILYIDVIYISLSPNHFWKA